MISATLMKNELTSGDLIKIDFIEGNGNTFENCSTISDSGG